MFIFYARIRGFFKCLAKFRIVVVDLDVDEVVGLAAIQEGQEPMAADEDVEMHHLLGADASDGMQGDDLAVIQSPIYD